MCSLHELNRKVACLSFQGLFWFTFEEIEKVNVLFDNVKKLRSGQNNATLAFHLFFWEDVVVLFLFLLKWPQ